MSRRFFTTGTVLAFLAVAAGALGAHALRGRLTPDLLAVWEIGARYGFYHAIALLVIALAERSWPGPGWTAAGWLFVGGTAIFSGSLFALSLTGARWLGALTPLGGLALLLGWISAGRAARRHIRPGERLEGRGREGRPPGET